MLLVLLPTDINRRIHSWIALLLTCTLSGTIPPTSASTTTTTTAITTTITKAKATTTPITTTTTTTTTATATATATTTTTTAAAAATTATTATIIIIISISNLCTSLSIKALVTGSSNNNNNNNNHNIPCKTLDFQTQGTQNQVNKIFTPPKINIAPEKWWLEDYFTFGNILFLGGYVKLPGSTTSSSIHFLFPTATSPGSVSLVVPRFRASKSVIQNPWPISRAKDLSVTSFLLNQRIQAINDVPLLRTCIDVGKCITATTKMQAVNQHAWKKLTRIVRIVGIEQWEDRWGIVLFLNVYISKNIFICKYLRFVLYTAQPVNLLMHTLMKPNYKCLVYVNQPRQDPTPNNT